MKPLTPLEKTSLSFSLCVLAAMGLARCTAAHGEMLVNVSSEKLLNVVIQRAEMLKIFETKQSVKPVINCYGIDKSVSTVSSELAYSATTYKSSEFGLVTKNNLAHNMPRLNAAFLCVPFQSAVMVRLDGDASARGSYLDYFLTNPVQSYHLRLVTNGKTSINLGVTHHV